MKKIKNMFRLLLALVIALAAYNFFYRPQQDDFKAFLQPHRQTAAVAEAGTQGGAAPQQGGELRVTVLDVGHGDAILLQGGGTTAMVDVGDYKSRDILLRKLEERGVKKIDNIFISHHHADHLGNILTVAQKYNTGKIYDNGNVNNSSSTSLKLADAFQNKRYDRQILGNGDKIILGRDYWLEVLSPGDFLDARVRADQNNSSLVFKLHYGKFTMMFTGDIENPVEAALGARYGKQLKADVLKVAHHGSRTSSNYRFISQVKPAYALISCGEFEKYHHPNQNVVGALEHLGATVYTTRQNGDLAVTVRDGAYTVAVEK